MDHRMAFALLALGLSISSPSAAQTPTKDARFNTFLAQVEAAENAFTKGDTAPMMALLADSPDVTLLGGAGGYVKGIDAIKARTSRISARYSQGNTKVEYLAARVEGDMAYTVSIDRRTIILDGDKTFDSALRTTHVFIKQNGQWKLLHRQSDPLVEEQPFGAPGAGAPASPAQPR